MVGAFPCGRPTLGGICNAVVKRHRIYNPTKSIFESSGNCQKKFENFCLTIENYSYLCGLINIF